MKILYLLLLTGLALFYGLYEDNLSLILLITSVTSPVISFILMCISAYNMKITSVSGDSAAKKGEDSEILLQIQNRSFLPVSSVCLWVISRTLAEGEGTELQKITVPVPSSENETISIQVTSQYCSRVEYGVEKAVVYDFFHLFRMKCRNVHIQNAHVDFLPTGNISLRGEYLNKLTVSDAVTYGSGSSRNRTTAEYNELRDYREGDKLNRVAWKLSGRISDDELTVRDNSGKGSPVILVMLLIGSADIFMADALRETCYKTMQTLAEHEILFDCLSTSGAFTEDISITDKFEYAVLGLYAESDKSPVDVLSAKERHYDVVYVVTEEENEEINKKIAEDTGAGMVCSIIPADMEQEQQ